MYRKILLFVRYTRYTSLFFIFLLFSPVALGQEVIFKTASGDVQVGLNPKAKILFFGVYDSAFPIFERAMNETKIYADLIPTPIARPLTELREEFRQISFEKYDVIFILQIDQFSSQVLAELLSDAKKRNQKLKVVQGLRRASHLPLMEIMEQDYKNFQSYYYNSPPLENFKRLLNYINIKYLGAKGEISPPLKNPRSGYYHPDYEKKFFEDFDSYLKWYKERGMYKENKPWVAVFVLSRYILQNIPQVHDALIKELEKSGINVCPISAHGKKLVNLTLECKPSLMILQHHFGVEGRSLPKPREKTILEKIGVPYLLALDGLRISVEEWKKNIKAGRWYEYSSISRHEMFGLIEPHIVGAQSSLPIEEPIQERVEKFVRKVNSWLNLQSKPNKEKKLAIIYFHIYQTKADVGRAGTGEMGRYLDVPKSLLKVLHFLSKKGYNIEPLPKYEAEILEWMRKNGRNIPVWSQDELEEFVNKAETGMLEFRPVLIDEEKYLSWFKSKLSPENQKLVIEKHGEPPGNRMVIVRNGKRYIVLPIINLTNVILAPQPEIGRFDQKLLKSKELPPSHNFLAFYFWLQEEFKPDALVHFGTFGSEIFLPGKEILLSKDCFPDLVIGNLPLIYVWAPEVVGIGVIAKRRPLAVLIDHMTTPLLQPELSFEFNELENKINQFLQTEGALKEKYRLSITNLSRRLNLLEQMGIELQENESLGEEQIKKLLVFLSYARTQNTPVGMRTFGTPLKTDEAIFYLANILLYNTDFFEKLKNMGVINEDEINSDKVHKLLDILIRLNLSFEEVSKLTGIEKKTLRNLTEEIEFAREVFKNIQKSPDNELNNLLNALDGKYIPPGPGGTPLANPYVLPTGRNMYGISPYQIPTKEAWEIAKKLANEFLEKYKKENGEYPKRVAFSLTGMTTFKDMGVTEAYILYLIGVKPIWTRGGLMSGYEIIPMEKLKRPRIDPLISVSSIYIKNFPNLIEIIDDAIQEVSNIEEKDNFVLKTSNEIEQKLLSKGLNEEDAKKLSTIRFFGSKPGESSARLVWLLPRSGLWNNQSDIFEVWENIRSHAFGKDVWGEENKILYELALEEREVVFTNWVNNLYGPLTNHHYAEETGGLALAIEKVNNKKPEIIVNDIRNKNFPRFVPYKDVILAELYATAFNKKWIESQMVYGYQGAAQFTQITDNLFQWESVQKGTVPKKVWDEMVNIYVDDKYGLNIQDFFTHQNPYAYQQMLSIMIEAARKGLWRADKEDLNEIVRIYATFVVQHGYDAGPYNSENERFQQFVQEKLKDVDEKWLQDAYKEVVKRFERVTGKIVETRTGEGRIIIEKNYVPIVITVLIFVFLIIIGFFKKAGMPR